MSALLENYIQEVVAAGNVMRDCMHIILKFLLSSIFVTLIICLRLYMQPIDSM